jgi:PilZ domain
MERRLPIIAIVRLAPAQGAAADGEERTYTDNISPHGARIFSKHDWQLDEVVWITLLSQDVACGKVVYCQRLPDNRYSIGVKFQSGPVMWSTLQKYNGLFS